MKGQQVVANQILQQLREKGLDSEEVLNQRIPTETNEIVTLLDMCINRKYRSGINFLLHTAQLEQVSQ